MIRFLRRLLGLDASDTLTLPDQPRKPRRDSALVLPPDPRAPTPSSLLEAGHACAYCGRPKQPPESPSCPRASCKAQATKARRQEGRKRQAKVLGGRWPT